MSQKRQNSTSPVTPTPERIVVRSYAVRHFSAYVIPPHSHDWHQLIYASEGVMWVKTTEGDWVVPPNRAVWVPAGVEHSIELSGGVLVQALYLATDVDGTMPNRCCAVNVSPLLRELVIHIVKLSVLNLNVAAHARLLGVLVDQLCALPTIPLQLPMPSDDRAKQAAEWLKAHPDDAGPIKQMAVRVSTGHRTLERLFRKETGMTYGKWRQQLRLLQALRLLAAGRSITEVALEVGYDSTSAFIAMFKRTLGTTPHRYFAPPGT
jgi:AraC-like DNA-binding protein